ncbi:DNA-binding MurR/RpiR family transcriptional regulator [Lactobacillus colini]|uniref:DNA-binding MurR/RpiR family transcriptional regulator n=1 Tax=Lactobacillus colini TaxID=1819254 RepID=A0ABS4MBW3_9LACO|nr:MurR/RpiR family transcriptional regulator [Lactobacillus colini]MBP2057103.1 DNA-binding MurR/RpiR family transcriptional regulator [Lactobacillus colini]
MTQFSFFKNQKYSASEQAIIDYLSRIDSFTNLTISQLAQATATSNATIIRLSRKAGFTGFSELKVALIKEIEEKKFTKQDVDFSFPFSPADSLTEIEQAMANLYQNSIQKLHSQIDTQLLLKVAQEFISAKRIFIFGTGDTGLTARSFINKINKLNIYPIFASSNNEQNSNWNNVHDGDLAIIITYDNFDEALKKYGIPTIHQNQGKVVAITANPDSFNLKEINYLIPIPNEEGLQKLATFYSQLAFEYVLNLLFSIIYRELALR